MWVPAHVGIACNAYADAVATAYLGNNDMEDASKVGPGRHQMMFECLLELLVLREI